MKSYRDCKQFDKSYHWIPIYPLTRSLAKGRRKKRATYVQSEGGTTQTKSSNEAQRSIPRKQWRPHWRQNPLIFSTCQQQSCSSAAASLLIRLVHKVSGWLHSLNERSIELNMEILITMQLRCWIYYTHPQAKLIWLAEVELDFFNPTYQLIFIRDTLIKSKNCSKLYKCHSRALKFQNAVLRT